LQTYFTVQQRHFDQLADDLLRISSDTLESVADHFEQDRDPRELNETQRHALKLLNKVNTISANIPGSHAAKIKARNEIRAYMGYYGLPHVYLTMNPNATDSPIFQVMI
ncbi:hypothetical protein SISSUDRAFT_957991, partial [Sistotremastrum suecicum HHB10207 ss-3]